MTLNKVEFIDGKIQVVKPQDISGIQDIVY